MQQDLGGGIARRVLVTEFGGALDSSLEAYEMYHPTGDSVAVVTDADVLAAAAGAVEAAAGAATAAKAAELAAGAAGAAWVEGEKTEKETGKDALRANAVNPGDVNCLRGMHDAVCALRDEGGASAVHFIGTGGIRATHTICGPTGMGGGGPRLCEFFGTCENTRTQNPQTMGSIIQLKVTRTLSSGR